MNRFFKMITLPLAVAVMLMLPLQQSIEAAVGTNQVEPPGGAGCTNWMHTATKEDFYAKRTSTFLVGQSIGMLGSPLISLGTGIVGIFNSPDYLAGWHIQTTQCITKVSDFPDDEWEVEYQIDMWDDDWDFKGTESGSYVTPPYSY